MKKFTVVAIALFTFISANSVYAGPRQSPRQPIKIKQVKHNHQTHVKYGHSGKTKYKYVKANNHKKGYWVKGAARKHPHRGYQPVKHHR